MRAQWSCPTVGTFSPSSLPKLLAASAVAVTVTLSTATVAHAARHEDPWDPNSWAPEAIGGAVGGAGGSGLLPYYLLKDIKKDTENTAKGSDLDRLREEVNNCLENKAETITNELKSDDSSLHRCRRRRSQLPVLRRPDQLRHALESRAGGAAHWSD